MPHFSVMSYDLIAIELVWVLAKERNPEKLKVKITAVSNGTLIGFRLDRRNSILANFVTSKPSIVAVINRITTLSEYHERLIGRNSWREWFRDLAVGNPSGFRIIF